MGELSERPQGRRLRRNDLDRVLSVKSPVSSLNGIFMNGSMALGTYRPLTGIHGFICSFIYSTNADGDLTTGQVPARAWRWLRLREAVGSALQRTVL